MWNAYPDSDPSRPVEPDENAAPGLAPPPPPGLHPVKLMVDGEHFVVTRRPGSPGTYDFDWTSHPESYGFTVGANSEWRPDRAEMMREIQRFLSQVDKQTGYLHD
jgi:hypothetical protein